MRALARPGEVLIAATGRIATQRTRRPTLSVGAGGSAKQHHCDVEREQQAAEDGAVCGAERPRAAAGCRSEGTW